MNSLYQLCAPLLIAFGILWASTVNLDSSHHSLPPLPSEAEVLYLPNGDALEQISFGYRNILADFLWFRTISYFGAHYRSDKNYQWLYHMCSLVTTLDPSAKHVYSFCSTMLAWESNTIDASNDILTRAINKFPADWMFFYLRGFNYLYFKKDFIKAHEDFLAASRIPGVHPLVAELAAKTTTQLKSPEVAADMLRGLIASTSDPTIRSAFEKKLLEITDEKGK